MSPQFAMKPAKLYFIVISALMENRGCFQGRTQVTSLACSCALCGEFPFVTVS